MNKTVTIFIIFLFAAFFVYGLAQQISESIKVGERLEKAADEVNALQDQNRNLKTQLSSVEESSFVEKVARDKLNLAKSGETVVIISDEAVNQVIEANKPIIPPPPLPNWERWVKLFI
jgi:cell division protein FtsB